MVICCFLLYFFVFLLSVKVESVAELTQRDTLSCTLTFTPMSNSGSPINCSAEREPTQTWGEHASSTQMVDFNP